MSRVSSVSRPELIELFEATTFPADETRMYGRPLAVTRALGAQVWCSHSDRPYLDLVHGYSATPLGHCHPVVVESVARHAGRVDMTHALPSEAQLRLSEEIRRDVPVPEARFHFTVGGAEAVSLALKVAFWKTRRRRVARLVDGFHGLNLDCVPLSADFVDGELYGAPIVPAESLSPGDPSAVTQIRSGLFAAAIVEPVQGAAGWKSLPTDWLRSIADACRASETVLIADEIQCGLGRCGHLFYSSFVGIEPDILLLGKGLAGGAYPIGAVIAKDALVRGMPYRGSGIGSTFSNSALGCAIALDVYKYIRDSDLSARARDLGASFLQQAERALVCRPVLGARAIGLGLALDFAGPEQAESFVNEGLERHILTYAAGSKRNVVKLSPPLTWSESDVRDMIGQLASVLPALRDSPGPAASGRNDESSDMEIHSGRRRPGG